MDISWWVDHIFTSSSSADGAIYPPPYPSTVPPADALELTRYIFANCGSLLKSFTDQQVADGLIFLGAAGESDWMHHLYDPRVEWRIRHDCMRSIVTLYRDCFARRCRSETVRSDDFSLRSLSGVCFMWWDRFPSSGMNTSDAEGEKVGRALLQVMADTLEIDHDACRGSALHGLGELGFIDDEWVEAVVDRWIERNPKCLPHF